DGLLCRADWDADTVVSNYRHHNWTVQKVNLAIADTLGCLGVDLILNYLVRAGADEAFGRNPDRRWDTEYQLPQGLARFLTDMLPEALAEWSEEALAYLPA